MVRNPLLWLGKADPVKSMDEAIELTNATKYGLAGALGHGGLGQERGDGVAFRASDPLRNAVHTLISIWKASLQLDIGYTAASAAAS